jgi:hypothetical protein
MITGERRLTAVQIILLAADDLMSAGQSEFTEWDLTVASWTRDRQRFGLRGYANAYPDHKRVMMEIMGKKMSNPILQRWMEKIRPNVYKLTALGRLEASRLKHAESGQSHKTPSLKDMYDRVATFVSHPAFQRWREEPSEPEKWADAAAFLGVKREAPASEAGERLQVVSTAMRSAIDFCTANGLDVLPQGTGRGAPSIHVRDLTDITAFLQALKYRFPEHLEAGGGGKRKPGKTPKS